MKPKVKVFSMFLAVMLQASMFLGIVSCSVNDNNGGHESVAATNFSYLISYGFDGYYDYSKEDDEVIFIPYGTPQLIRNIYDVLKSLKN